MPVAAAFVLETLTHAALYVSLLLSAFGLSATPLQGHGLLL